MELSPYMCGPCGKHVACQCPAKKSVSNISTTKDLIALMNLADADYKFSWSDIGGPGSASEAHMYIDSELKTVH